MFVNVLKVFSVDILTIKSSGLALLSKARSRLICEFCLFLLHLFKCRWARLIRFSDYVFIDRAIVWYFPNFVLNLVWILTLNCWFLNRFCFFWLQQSSAAVVLFQVGKLALLLLVELLVRQWDDWLQGVSEGWLVKWKLCLVFGQHVFDIVYGLLLHGGRSRRNTATKQQKLMQKPNLLLPYLVDFILVSDFLFKFGETLRHDNLILLG